MSTRTTLVTARTFLKARRLVGNPLIEQENIRYSSSGLISGVKTVTSESSPRRWRNLIREGLNATTGASGSDNTNIVLVPGSVRLQRTFVNPNLSFNNSDELAEGTFLVLSPLSIGGYTLDGAFTSAQNRSLTNLYSHLSSVETAFKGMVFTGEIRESLRMIKSPALSLRKGVGDYLRSLLKRVPRKAPRRLKRKIIADTWLEYSFGWMPLINDLDSAITALYKSKTAHPIFQMVRGFGKVESATNGPIVGDAPPGYLVSALARTMQKEQIAVKHYGIYVSTGKGISNNHSYGFRPAEFIPTLWELMPYSFLVDYFTNIGDIISSWSYRFIGLRWCSRTTFQDVVLKTYDERMQAAVSFDDPSVQSLLTGHPGSASVTISKFNRIPSVALSVPSLELEVPGMKSVKWVNISALLLNLGKARAHINPT